MPTVISLCSPTADCWSQSWDSTSVSNQLGDFTMPLGLGENRGGHPRVELDLGPENFPTQQAMERSSQNPMSSIAAQCFIPEIPLDCFFHHLTAPSHQLIVSPNTRTTPESPINSSVLLGLDRKLATLPHI